MSKKNGKRNIKKYNLRRNTDKNRCVYVCLSKTSTLPSNVIKLWTKEPYAHTSLALDMELNEMYSFARKRLHNPFYCGLIMEDITTGVFGRDVDTMCLILRIWVTADEFKRIRRILSGFWQNKNLYKYNYIGIAGVMFGKAVERRYNYFCSQFVYSVLQRAGVELFKKKPGLVRPEDFRVWDVPEVIYEGKLNHYREFLSDFYPRDPATGDYLEERGINLHTLENFEDKENSLSVSDQISC